MLRRALALAVVVAAVTAVPALADQCHYHSQMKYGSETASRSAGGCTISEGWLPHSLEIDCPAHKHATLTYTFATRSKVKGAPSPFVSSAGSATVKRQVATGRSSITVTVSVYGDGSAQVNSVSVGYYA